MNFWDFANAHPVAATVMVLFVCADAAWVALAICSSSPTERKQ